MTTYYVDGLSGSDSNPGTSAGSAKATVQAGLNLMASGDQLAVLRLAGVYPINAPLTVPSGLDQSAKTRIRGYGTTPGDGVRVTLRATGAFALFAPGHPCSIEDLILDGNGTATTGVVVPTYGALLNCLVMGCGVGISMSATSHVNGCEITGCTTKGIDCGSYGQINDCWIHDNSCRGIDCGGGSNSIVGCVLSNNTGSSSDGIYISGGFGVEVRACTIDAPGRHAIHIAANYDAIQPGLINCLLTRPGGYGIAFDSAPAPAAVVLPEFRNNAFWISGGSGAYAQSFSGLGDVTLTANPYVNSPSNNFGLNTAAGGGALCRGAGYPGAFPGGVMVGEPDIGALQHQDPSISPSVATGGVGRGVLSGGRM